jgi:hypothetical protein
MAGAHCMSDAVLSVPGGRPWTWGSSAKSLSVITGRAWMSSAWTYGSKGWGFESLRAHHENPSPAVS